MERTPKIEQEGGEAEINPEARKESLIEANPKIFSDKIFQEILSSIDEKWDQLSESKRSAIIDALSDLVDNLDKYHDSYIGLKFAASPERHASQDIEKYQAAVKAADEREHILHNAFIDSVNILSRKMKSTGLDNGWRASEEIDGLDQKATREKMKKWMFGIFEERMIEHL